MNLLALSNVISVLLLHEVVRQHHCHAKNVKSSSSSDLSFDSPDLTATLRLRDQFQTKYKLLAYKAVQNEGIYKKIRNNNDTSLKSLLKWYSFGHPVPLLQRDEIDPNKTTIVQMGYSSFSILFNMLTDEHINLLKQIAEKQTGVDIDEQQIDFLTLADFICHFSLYDKQGKQYMFKGHVENFNTFPLLVTFPLSKGSKEDMVFKEQLPSLDYSNWPDLKCSMAANAKDVKTNTLSITSQQIDQIGMKEKLFGDTSGGQNEEVYVTRDQMAEFSKEMYASLNIIEEYDMPESQFSEAFVNGLIQQASATSFKDVPIDEALASLSKYRVDVTADLRPDEIKSELSNILKVDEKGDTKRIVEKRSKAAERERADAQKGSESGSTTNSQSNRDDKSTSESNDSSKSGQSRDARTHGQKTNNEKYDSADISHSNTQQSSSANKTEQSSLQQKSNHSADASADAVRNSGSQSKEESSMTHKEGGGSVDTPFGGGSVHYGETNANSNKEASAFDNTKKHEQQRTDKAESLDASKLNQETSKNDFSKNDGKNAQVHSSKDGKEVYGSSDQSKASATRQQSASSQSSAVASALHSAVKNAKAFAKNNQARTSDEVSSLDDQLNKLNRKTRNDMQWQFQGNKVIPKSINVARMARGGFTKTLNFNRVKIHKLDAEFTHSFTVSTARLRLKASPNVLMKLSDRVDKLEALKLSDRVDKLEALKLSDRVDKLEALKLSDRVDKLEALKLSDRVDKLKALKLSDRVDKLETLKLSDRVDKLEALKLSDRVDKLEALKLSDHVNKLEALKLSVDTLEGQYKEITSDIVDIMSEIGG